MDLAKLFSRDYHEFRASVPSILSLEVCQILHELTFRGWSRSVIYIPTIIDYTNFFFLFLAFAKYQIYIYFTLNRKACEKYTDRWGKNTVCKPKVCSRCLHFLHSVFACTLFLFNIQIYIYFTLSAKFLTISGNFKQREQTSSLLGFVNHKRE